MGKDERDVLKKHCYTCLCTQPRNLATTRNTMLAANLIGGILFSGIGFVAFVYGRKQTLPKAVALGIALMAYPYFVENTIALYVIGFILSAALLIVKD